ncbi:e3 binding domain protein [Teladorsagia circumcincta]|uniref:dihydrolipoyllysine-residue (2-methylpropanoyl)transferase n=1 Tax=Teladorsagia circumcincta TaxID=45464 RepID=A0A2G9TNX9_TELCI|nr:e3 binding domain protein [Teladorsagia circumcincta]
MSLVAGLSVAVDFPGEELYFESNCSKVLKNSESPTSLRDDFRCWYPYYKGYCQDTLDEAIACLDEQDEKEAPKAETPSAASAAAPRSSSDSEAPAPASPGKVLATPAVRRVAMENKVDLKQVKGSGKEGRVLKEDVLKFLGQVKEDYSSGSTNIRYSPAIATQAKVFSPLSEDRVVPVRGYTRAMIKTMTEALKIPHFGYDDEVCADALIAVRKELKELAKDRNVKLSYMPFFIKAVSLALLEYPSLNASVDEKLENVVYKASHNICLAMDTPGGLVVPNIKNCEQRNQYTVYPPAQVTTFEFITSRAKWLL